MKKTFIIIFLFSYQINFSQSLFQKADEVDEFGDKIGQVYKNVTTGTFSNAATNNSKLIVHAIYEQSKEFEKVKEFKTFYLKKMVKEGFDESYAKHLIGGGRILFKVYKQSLGELKFNLFEYGEHLRSSSINHWGRILIKKSNGKKFKADITPGAIRNGVITIVGYKNHGDDSTLILSEYRDQSIVFEEIMKEKDKVDVVIQIGNSTYKFTMKNKS